MTTLIHNQILNKTARDILRPLGIKQRGRSRTWIDDHGWWIVVIEFQPSGWARGSYLNVGVMWLWRDQDYISFDLDYRKKGFIEFQNERQFVQAAEELSHLAASEATRHRELFPNVKAAADYYLSDENESNGFWPSFNAGIACGLAGYTDEAKRFFSRVNTDGDDRDWVVRAAETAANYQERIEDSVGFRRHILRIIKKTQAALHLEEALKIDMAG